MACEHINLRSSCLDTLNAYGKYICMCVCGSRPKILCAGQKVGGRGSKSIWVGRGKFSLGGAGEIIATRTPESPARLPHAW